MKYSNWLWPALLLVSALATWIAYTLLSDGIVRPFIVLWFFVICPGMALVRLLRLRNLLAEYTLAVATSLTLETLVASIQLYANHWSPTLTLNILVGVCIVGALLQLVVLRSTTKPLEQPAVGS